MKKLIALRIDEETLQKLVELKKKTGYSLSKQIRLILQSFFIHKEPKEAPKKQSLIKRIFN